MAEATGSMPTIGKVAPKPGVAPAAPGSVDPSKSTGSLAVNAPFQIQSMLQRTPWMKLLVYGKHGSGKTELAGSAVDCEPMQDVLMIDAESGELTLQDSPRIQNADRIYHIRVTTFKQVARVQEFLKAYCKAREENNVERMRTLYSQVSGIPAADIDYVPKFKTVIIDSLTEVETYCVYGILGIDSSKVVDEDIETAGWPEFRKNNEMVKLLVRAFRDLPMHCIFVCAEQYTQDEQKRYHYTPALTGKLSAQVQGFVDIVGWLTVGAPQDGRVEAPRRMYIQPISTGPKFDAKNRRPTYKNAFFDDPTMPAIMKLTGTIR